MKYVILILSCLIFSSTAFAELPSGNQFTIQAALASGLPTIVDFGAQSCTPCKKMAPILEQLAKDYKGRANIIFVDVWQDNSMGKRYGVQMIPTQLFFNTAGKASAKHIGFLDRQSIIDILKKLGMK